MKTIYLVRHGKAIKRNVKLPDFQRTLVKKGKEESLNMAKKNQKSRDKTGSIDIQFCR